MLSKSLGIAILFDRAYRAALLTRLKQRLKFYLALTKDVKVKV